MPLNFSIISVWYGTSKSGTTGSPNLSSSTFSLSSFPIGTDGSIIFGITIILFLISSAVLFSSAVSSSILSFPAATFALISSASSFLPSFISPPIFFDKLFFSARSDSTSFLILRFWSSNSITSSTNGSFLSWNLFLIFCLTISGFSLTNLISNIFITTYFLCFFALFYY